MTKSHWNAGILCLGLALLGSADSVCAQANGVVNPTPAQAPAGGGPAATRASTQSTPADGEQDNAPQKTPPDVVPPISSQAPHKVSARLMEGLTPDKSSLFISLSNQRAYLMMDGAIVIDTPVSSGKRTAMTPVGEFRILEKIAEHRSRRFGDFVDDDGRIVREGVSAHIDAAPSGTRFSEVVIPHFLRLTNDDVGIHAGPLPGYPAADRSIRLPEEIAEMVFHKVAVGTPVTIVR